MTTIRSVLDEAQANLDHAVQVLYDEYEHLPSEAASMLLRADDMIARALDILNRDATRCYCSHLAESPYLVVLHDPEDRKWDSPRTYFGVGPYDRLIDKATDNNDGIHPEDPNQ